MYKVGRVGKVKYSVILRLVFNIMLFRYFATAGADRKIKIWEISKGINVDLKCTLAGSNAAVMGVDFDTTGSMILGASNDFATRIWSIEDSRLRHTLTGGIVLLSTSQQ